MRDCKRKAWTNTSNISMSSLETSHTARIILGIWEGFTNYLWSAGSTLRLWMSKTRLLWEGMRPLSLKWKTIRKRASPCPGEEIDRCRQGSRRGGRLEQEADGRRILQGCRGHPEHHPISWSGAGRRKRGFKSRRVLPKWNWIGNICAGGNFFKKIIKCMRLGQTGSTVSPDNLMFKSLIIFCICTRPKYKYGQWTVSTGHCSGP